MPAHKHSHQNIPKEYRKYWEPYKSTDPARTFQVMSLDPIKVEDIIKIENLDSNIKIP